MKIKFDLNYNFKYINLIKNKILLFIINYINQK